jgi:hypothetical protein
VPSRSDRPTEGNCPLCLLPFDPVVIREGKVIKRSARYPVWDHCHDCTGFRGFICNKCNGWDGNLRAGLLIRHMTEGWMMRYREYLRRCSCHALPVIAKGG